MTRAAAILFACTIAVLTCLVALNASSSPARPTQRQIDRIAEAEYRLPSGILARHRGYERAMAGRCYDRDWNDNKGQVCGQHQILVWNRTSRDGKRLGRIVRTRLGGVAGAAYLMDASRSWCLRKDKGSSLDKGPGKVKKFCKCPWARLNFGDQTRLCGRLEPDKQGDES